MRCHLFTSVALLPKTCNYRLVMKSTSHTPRLRDSPQTPWPVLLKTVSHQKQGKSEKLSQPQGGQGDTTTKCNVAFWTGSQNRERTWGKNWGGPNKAQTFINNNAAMWVFIGTHAPCYGKTLERVIWERSELSWQLFCKSKATLKKINFNFILLKLCQVLLSRSDSGIQTKTRNNNRLCNSLEVIQDFTPLSVLLLSGLSNLLESPKPAHSISLWL